MSGHTPEPWPKDGQIQRGVLFIVPATQNGGVFEWWANKRRIVACVNACAGIPNELLEQHPAAISEVAAQSIIATEAENTALRTQVADLRAALYRSDRALYRGFTSDGIGRAEADRVLLDNAAVLAATQPQEVQS